MSFERQKRWLSKGQNVDYQHDIHRTYPQPVDMCKGRASLLLNLWKMNKNQPMAITMG
jgi:hypothetical protein